MLTTEIVVESPPYFVWACFVHADNWGAWAKVSLSTAHWEVGGRLYFEKGVTSTVDAISEGHSVTFGDTWSEETWEFEPTPAGHTLVRMTERPRAMRYTDHGRAAIARNQAKLERLKALIEARDEVTAWRAATAASSEE